MAVKWTAEAVSLLRAGDVRGLVSRYADLTLAAMVVAIVAMMIVPLPTLVLDLLISLNIATAVVLLLVSIYVTDALRIATFPTLLLLTTLFRLSLEVSATRLILVKAHAGAVIHAFGAFMVAGNLVVGAVIFLILTIIQFIVISKGSERVAEVAARFTLDAMPGKQLGIDAELRAGHIDGDEASRRRAALARESQLFGSMDGAMKFVKGDAVAGLIVLAVNIIGGLIIGTVQRGMDLATAARAYTLLTIGEGLVTQIPALIISTAAGIIVTRVAAEEEGSHLGREIAEQILAHPKALAIAAGLLVLLAVVPGLPAFPFLLLATALGFVAFRLLRSPPTAGGPATGGVLLRGGRPTADDRQPDASLPPTPLLTPIEVQLGVALSAHLCPDHDPTALAERLADAVRARLFDELGIPLPALVVRSGVHALAPHGYLLRLNEIPLHRHDFASGPAPSPQLAIADALLTLLRRHGHQFIDIEETHRLVAALQRTHPALVREVIPKLVSTTLLADVLRRLAQEGISLRNLKDILGALALWAPAERDPVALTEHVRAALRRAITQRHANASGVLGAYTLDPMIEETVREALHKTAQGTVLALEPSLSRDIVAAVGRAVGGGASFEGGPVILTSGELRRHVRGLVEAEHPDLAVLAYLELASEAKVQPLGRIRT